MRKISIIIVSYNGGQKLLKTVEYVKKILKKNKNTNLIVVDNASKDNSIEEIKKIIQPVILFRNKKNIGFAKAINQGARKAIKNGAERILLLNQDVYIKRSKNFSFLVKDQSNIVSPVIKFKRKAKFIYDIGGRLNRFIMRPYHLERQTKPKRTHKIDYVSGCCMLVDSSVLKEIGYFDERFFLYFEDVDFCLRASKAGFNIGVELNAEVFHDLLEREQKTMMSTYNLIKSHLIFINRWTRFPKRLVAYFYWFFISLKILFSKIIYSLI